MTENLFMSSIMRFGSILFPQILLVENESVTYTKYKFKNYFGIPIDEINVNKRYINSVKMISHFFTGTELMIDVIDGSQIYMKNLKREDAEKINNLILNI